MKLYIRSASKAPIFEDDWFSFYEESGIGVNNTPWRGLRVKSKGAAEKHVVEIRLNSKRSMPFNGEPVDYKYTGAYISHGMRGVSDTIEDTREYIEVLADAVDFAGMIDDWLKTDGREWLA